jgi:release factor glutamine methyltransferase
MAEMSSPRPDLVAALRAAGCVYAEEEAGLLLEAADGSAARLTGLLERRVAGVPLEQLLGWVAFSGLRLRVCPGVFVPRRRSEVLVQAARALLAPGDLVVDLCCGNGAVGAALEAAVPGVEVHAVDIDPVAVACARQNLTEPSRVHVGDLFDPLPGQLRGRIALVVANAPYVPTDALRLMPAEARLHEPRHALDGGADGVQLHRRIASGAAGWLTEGGRLLVETSQAQLAATCAAFTAAGIGAEPVRDDVVDGTAVLGVTPGPPPR